ncbi:MAG: ATP-binding protein [Deltaproteobacteria bacterium]|nr:ATP-binding protein [Deltaproteobacteria bacterium]
MALRLTLSNRLENQKLLEDFIQKWAQQRGLSANRRTALPRVAGTIFRHLVTQAYRPPQPGSISISLEEKGPRLCLVFEDDAPAHSPEVLNGLTTPEAHKQNVPSNSKKSQPIAESLIYYRTGDRKNRLVVFLTL